MKPNSNYLFVIPEDSTSEKITSSGIIYEREKPSDKPTEEATLKGFVDMVGSNVNRDMKPGERIAPGNTVHYSPHDVVENPESEMVMIHRRDILLVE